VLKPVYVATTGVVVPVLCLLSAVVSPFVNVKALAELPLDLATTYNVAFSTPSGTTILRVVALLLL